MNSEHPWASGASNDSAMLGAIVDTSGSVILGLRPDHRIFAWNRAAEELYLTPRSTAIGLDYVNTFLAPEHRDAVAADIREVLAGKRTLNFEDDSILPDGRRRTLLWNVTRVLDDAGEPFGIVATGQDITERKEAEERFRLVFESAQDGLLLSDDSGVIDCNPAALAMIGLTDKAQLLGRRPADFSPAAQPDGTPSDAKSRGLGAITLAQGSHTFDWVHAKPDGTPVPVEVSVRHTQMGGRRVSVIVWRDQSRRMELERTREEVQQRLNLSQRLESVGHLAGGVAHDFNNLLAAIRNSIELALQEVPAEFAFRADLDVALETTERAARLTSQLLAFSRKQPRRTEPVQLSTLVQGMVPLLRTSLPASITLAVHTGVDDGAVLADRGQLEQVLVNLVLNARDAMPRGGELHLRVRAGARETTLEVTDTGSGIDDAIRSRIFEPFFTTKPVGHGTGLGLAVVYGVISQAGGTVRADSAPGRGATFIITLPTVDDVVVAAVPPASVPADVAGTILLVDDDAAVRSTTRRLLQRLRYAVVEAASGAEALELFAARRAQISVLLTDIRMPGMDGTELAHQVREQAPGFPVVFISGYDAVGHTAVDGLEDVEMIPKPFTGEQLARALQAAVRLP